jgi:drug/metabolite transporter (DMT)-like permease
MNWLLLSLLLPLFSSAFSLASKELLKYTQPTSYTAYVLLVSGVGAIVYNLVAKKAMYVTPLSVVSGIVFGLATFGFESAVSVAKNPGLVNALYRSQAALTALLSVYFLNSKLSLAGGIGVVMTVFGAYLAAMDKNSEREGRMSPHKALRPSHRGRANGLRHEPFTQEEHHLPQTSDQKDSNWVLWVAIAGVLMTIKDLTAVKCIKNGMKASNYVVSQLLFGGLVMLAYKLYKTGTLSLELKDESKRKEVIIGIGGAALDNLLWCAVLVYAMSIAPNPGYPKALTLLSVVITAFVSRYLFEGAALDKRQWAGIGTIVAGIGTMVFG